MNPYIRTNVVEIDLLDLVRYLLKRIAWILAAGIVCAGALGAYQYHHLKSAPADSQAITQAETEYEQKLEEYQQESELIDASNLSTAALAQKQKEYLLTSPFMQLDPYHVWRAEAVVRVASRSEEFPAWQLEEIYKSELLNAEYLRALAKERKTDWSYLKELVMVDSWDRSAENTLANILPLEESDRNNSNSSRVFLVRVYGREEEEAWDLMHAVQKELQRIYEEKSQAHPHEMKILSDVCALTVDTEIRTRQKDHVTYTQTLLSQMTFNTDTTAKLSKPAAASQPAQGGISKRSLLKYGLIGFVIGVFLMCAWYVLRYIRNDKLVDYRDLVRRGMSLKELGSVSDQGIAMAAANIRNFAGEKKRLFLTGMTQQAQFDQTCTSLKEYLSEYELVYARDVLHDPKARELLLNCDAAVLVEQKGETRYSDMKEEITFLVNAGKEIVGMVIV